MRCKSSDLFPHSLQEIYRLSHAEHIFLDNIKKNTFNETTFFKNLTVDSNFAFIIKIAKASKRFESLCKKTQYRGFWNDCHGLLLKDLSTNLYQETNLFFFFEHKDVCSFDLFRGAYLYLASLLTRQQYEDFSFTEIDLLKEAINYKSIHALQRFSHYVFNNNIPANEKELLFVKYITNCKKMLNFYGSYAYMMLADAFFYYSQVLLGNENHKLAPAAISSALLACEEAKLYLEVSKASIHSASLGQGLKTSNYQRFDSPEELAYFIIDYEYDQNNTPSKFTF